jgi:NAD(P)-dependent dehydrogenase (short-subunit alcohol dehydrogenase family)
MVSSDEMMKVLKINVVGTFNMSKYAAWYMSKQEPIADGERGVIINVASVAGEEGQKGQVVYSASKGAIIGMTLPMARDLGKYGIRVMTIAPGVFATPMGDHIPQKAADVLKSSTPLGRLGQAP